MSVEVKPTELNGGGRLYLARTVIETPHGKESKRNTLPLFGRGYHNQVMQQVDKAGLLRQPTSEVCSLANLVLQNLDDPVLAELYENMKFSNGGLWTATESDVGSEDILVYDVSSGESPSRAELVKRSNDGDPTVAKIGFDFKRGYIPLNELMKHSYFLGQMRNMDVAQRTVDQLTASEKGAWVYGPTPDMVGQKRKTAVDFDDNGNALCFYGDYHGCSRDYYAVGVEKTGEASAQNQ